jgi:DNA-binding beta-propeller fold protein YncE
MNGDRAMKKLVLVLFFVFLSGKAAGQTSASNQLMYVGTIDKKLLVIDEVKEEVIDQIALGGIPRATALSADKKQLHIFTTQMLLETIDLQTRKIVSSFSLADPRTRVRIQANAPDLVNLGGNSRYSGIAVDPQGRYLYTTMRTVLKDIDQYRIDPPQFVAIDLQEKKIAKAWPFPKEMDQGFGFNASYKVSSDGKRLYVFQEDILIFDLETFKQVDKIELAQPPYPGASPYRVAASDDPFDAPDTVTSVFTSVDSIVHKGTLGLAKIDLTTSKVDYFPIGPLLPMNGFQLSPDRKRGYSVMPKISTGANRATEWWVWDLENHKVIKKQEFDSRPTFRFAVGGDGKKLYLYGAGSTLEVWDAATLQSRKLIYLNKDTTTNLITLPQLTRTALR